MYIPGFIWSHADSVFGTAKGAIFAAWADATATAVGIVDRCILTAITLRSGTVGYWWLTPCLAALLYAFPTIFNAVFANSLPGFLGVLAQRWSRVAIEQYVALNAIPYFCTEQQKVVFGAMYHDDSG